MHQHSIVFNSSAQKSTKADYCAFSTSSKQAGPLHAGQPARLWVVVVVSGGYCHWHLQRRGYLDLGLAAISWPSLPNLWRCALELGIMFLFLRAIARGDHAMRGFFGSLACRCVQTALSKYPIQLIEKKISIDKPSQCRKRVSTKRI